MDGFHYYVIGNKNHVVLPTKIGNAYKLIVPKGVNLLYWMTIEQYTNITLQQIGIPQRAPKDSSAQDPSTQDDQEYIRFWATMMGYLRQDIKNAGKICVWKNIIV